jgi:hypothetical protein
MSKTGLNRRQFIQGSARTVGGGVAATVAVSASGCAQQDTALDAPTLDTLTAMSRRLYPHDRLSDAHYRTSIEGLEEKAAQNSPARTLLMEGVRALDEAASPARFIELDVEGQRGVLESQQETVFFEAVRSHVVVALYQDKRVWAKLGYEGPSYPLGGYLERGFDDIDWLPETS